MWFIGASMVDDCGGCVFLVRFFAVNGQKLDI
jgi:hypothetical protein